jgi:hypothetical protein
LLGILLEQLDGTDLVVEREQTADVLGAVTTDDDDVLTLAHRVFCARCAHRWLGQIDLPR